MVALRAGNNRSTRTLAQRGRRKAPSVLSMVTEQQRADVRPLGIGPTTTNSSLAEASLARNRRRRPRTRCPTSQSSAKGAAGESPFITSPSSEPCGISQTKPEP